MFSSVLGFELKYRLRRPATYIYFLLCFAFGLLIFLTDVARIGGGFGKVNTNAPFILLIWVGYMSTFLGFFLFSAIMSVPIYRDYEHNTHTFLYTYPLDKWSYIGGRYIGSLIIAAVVILGFPLGLMTGELISKLKATPAEAANWGPFMLGAYIMPVLTVALPNLLALGSLYFSIPTLTRKIFFTYVLSVSILVLYALSSVLLDKLYVSGYKVLARMLDPFGFSTFGDITEYWSIAEKNNQLVPLEGVFLWNRLLWSAIGLGVFIYCYFKFKFEIGGSSSDKSAAKEPAILTLPDLSAIKRPSLIFGASTVWTQFKSIVSVEFKSTIRNPFFLVFLVTIAIYKAMDAWYADQTYGTGIYPVTSVMIDQFTGTYTILMIALLIFLAGEVVWRERQIKIDQLYNVLPVPKAVPYLAKFVALMVVPAILNLMLVLLLMLVQTFKGYFDYEPGLYLQYALLISYPKYILFVILAFVIQITVNNKFIGHGVMLVVLILFNFGVVNRLGLEHPLWDYGTGMNLSHSQMDGFGEGVPQFLTYGLHWYLVGTLMLIVGYLLSIQGVIDGPKARFAEAVARFNASGALKFGTILIIVAMLGTGYYIYHLTVDIDGFRSEKQSEELQVAFEKRYKYLQDRPHPKITSVKMEVDMEPENLKMKLAGHLTIKNKTFEKIDTIWMNTDAKALYFKPKFSVKTADVAIDEQFAHEGFKGFKLETSLMPGDSILFDYEYAFERRGFENTTNLRHNGTFFNSSNVVPALGYPSGVEMQDEDKRAEYGLKPQPPLPPVTDTAALKDNFFSSDADYINFEVTLSTAPDQIAIAPGYLTKQWQANGRAYFHYKMDQPMGHFFNIISARYQITKDQHKGINIEIYHLPEHAYNVQKMITSVKSSLDYYGENYWPYQHKQVRILEFPRFQGSFAQSFANTIPYSEDIGFIANLKDPEDIDYVYYVTAHEMSHQWWGHMITPAGVRGGQFLSETMSQYSAMMVMKQLYGENAMTKFLKYELRSYLSGRSAEKRGEKSLMDIEQQAYVYYRKGSVVMYALQNYIGEQVFNKAVGKFVRQYKFAGPPYPHIGQWYDTVKANVPANWHPFLDDQLTKITLYDNRALEAKGKMVNAKDSTYEITIKYKSGKFYADTVGNTNEKPLPLNIGVDFGLLTSNRPTAKEDVILVQRLPVNKTAESTVKIKGRGRKPEYAAIDPILMLVDKNSDDNFVRIDW